MLVQVLLMLVAMSAKSVGENCTCGRNGDQEEDILPADYSWGSTSKTGCSKCLMFIMNYIFKDFSVDVQLLTHWVDDKILKPKRNNSLIFLSTKITDKLFIPFLEFTNCKACDQLIIDRDKHPLRLMKKNIIFYTFRKKISFNCIFDLSRYPFDVQICRIIIKLFLMEMPVKLSIVNDANHYENFVKKRMTMPSEFKLTKIQVLEFNCTDIEENISPGYCFSYDFTFERTVLQHVLLIFLPSSLIVMLSWISFWLDVELAAPRVALGQTSLLTLAAQFNSVQNNLPPVSSVKAIDIWMFTCILMAFASILEYALAYNYNQRPSHQRNQVGPKRKIKHMYEQDKEGCSQFKSIDMWAKILFPLGFLIFNIAFWGWLLFKELFP